MATAKTRRDFLTTATAVTAGLPLAVATFDTAVADESQATSGGIDLKKHGRSLSIELAVPQTVRAVEVRIFSQANENIFEYDDISPYAPTVDNEQTRGVWTVEYDQKAKARRQSDREQRFPVVDVVLQRAMEAVIEIDLKGPGKYGFNDLGSQPIAKEIRIPYEQVEYWGNRLSLNPKTNSIEHFYLAAKTDVENSKVKFDFETLRDDWVGEISVHDADTKELIAKKSVSSDVKLKPVSTGSGVSRQRMIQSLSWATKYVLGCQNTNPYSDDYGGEFLLYDLSAKTRLRSDWSWSWGPSAKMMLEASRIEGVDVGMSRESLLRRSVDLGYATLRKQIHDPSHPANGVLRTSRNVASTVDTLFLVGWGWMPLYKATKNERFLEAAQRVASAADRLMKEHDGIMIPQSFDLKDKKGKNMMSFESSMGLPGIAALYMTTGREQHRDIMIRLANLLVNAFEQEDGLWGKLYDGETGQTVPTNYWTKALGYCVDGLIEVHRAAPDETDGRYLKKALRITEHVLKAQAADGSWSVRFDRSAEFVGVCDKSTALWAGLLIRLYKITGDETYFNAGMKAIQWGMDNQYFGEDPIARGAIVGRSWPSGITFRHWWDVVVTYTVSFFGNALAEALSLEQWKD